jgi:hypothetical protein
MQTQSHHRRPGIFLGRRFALATVAACAAAAAGAALPASAAADQTIVSATIFPGTAGNDSIQPVLLSTLASKCATYAGPSWTFSDGQAPQTTGTAWSLGDVISCGLSIPAADVAAVQVFNGDNNTYEDALNPSAVFAPSTYPSGAFPLISVDGSMTSGGAVTYTRPPATASDPAESDQFTEDGTTPVSIDVYENQAPLQVTAAPVYGASNTSSQTVMLAATVTGPDGSAIDPSQLTWNWTFAGSPVGSTATPTVTLAAGESELATVVVTDQATGAGGTASFPVSYSPVKGPANQPPSGAGTNQHGAPTGQPKGKQHSHGRRKLKHGGALKHAGTNTGAAAIGRQRHPTTPSQTSTAPTPTTTPTTSPTPPPAAAPAAPPTIQTTTVTTPAPTTTPGLTVVTSPTKVPQRRRSHAPKRRSVAQPGASQREVRGRLVADVQALPQSESPLVHPIAGSAAAPSLVHAAGDGTSAPTWAFAGLGVLALLGGGALYERRGRRGRTLHR